MRSSTCWTCSILHMIIVRMDRNSDQFMCGHCTQLWFAYYICELCWNGMRNAIMCGAITWRMNEHQDAKDANGLRSELERRRELIRTLEADVSYTDRLIGEHAEWHAWCVHLELNHRF